MMRQEYFARAAGLGETCGGPNGDPKVGDSGHFQAAATLEDQTDKKPVFANQSKTRENALTATPSELA